MALVSGDLSFWRESIPPEVVAAAFEYARSLSKTYGQDPPPTGNPEPGAGNCGDCGAVWGSTRGSDPLKWWAEIGGRWIHLCVKRCEDCDALIYSAAPCPCRGSDRPILTIDEALESTIPNAERLSWQQYHGDATRCGADLVAGGAYGRRCGNEARKGSLYCGRHPDGTWPADQTPADRQKAADELDSLARQLRREDAAIKKEAARLRLETESNCFNALFVTPVDPLEVFLDERGCWGNGFELDLATHCDIGGSLHGSTLARWVLDQLPPDDGPLELAGDGRPWAEYTYAGMEFPDEDMLSMKHARAHARATHAGPYDYRSAEWDFLRVRPGCEERIIGMLSNARGEP